MKTSNNFSWYMFNKSPMFFVILMGIVSLFADMTYEGARSITGPYLAVLGASAAVVATVAGLGELIAYSLRIISGIIADRTGQYWTITIVGYSINLFAVPLMALTGSWETAALIIMAERLGKAVRTPARDAMLSHASHGLGRGWAFGVHEAMDQIGAMIGPTIVTLVLAWKGSYKYGFAVLLVPALLAITVLAITCIRYPKVQDMEPSLSRLSNKSLPSTFWIYLLGGACIALGFIDYPLVAFHMKTKTLVADHWIPLLYAGTMGIDALSGLVFGRLYDKKGTSILLILIGVSAWNALFIFMGGFPSLILGLILWGIGVGTQESILRALVSEITPRDQRAKAYGIFNAGFGLAWFLGSIIVAVLYDERSFKLLTMFSVAAQLASLPLIYFVRKNLNLNKPAVARKT